MDEANPEPFGKYELISRLAVGGMAELFLARTRGLSGFEKYLVLKRILRERTTDKDFVRMFLDEARIAATLDHPNVVQIYDVGNVDGEFFIAMEYISGRNLVELLKARQKADGEGGLPVDVAIAIVCGAAAGLHYAHEKRDFSGRPMGIVHRDVTPQNVMVTYDGGVKLVDFGIVKAASREVDTNAGTLKGKFGYMSPEQCTGLSLDGRSDIFALGVLLYELLCGKRLYREKTEFETLRQIVDGQVPSILSVDPKLPVEVDAIVSRCLQKDREQRFRDARELVTALEDVARELRFSIGVTLLAKYVEQLFPVAAREHHTNGGVISLALARSQETQPSYFGEANGDKTKASVPMSRAKERFLRRRRWNSLALGGVGVLALGVGLWQLEAFRHDALPKQEAQVVPAAAAPPLAPMDSAQLNGAGDAQPQLLDGKPATLPSATLPLSPTIICRLLVGADGRVQKAQVFRSRLELAVYEDAAITTAQAYRFRPALHAGQPVPAWINWPVRFAPAK